MPIKVTCQCGKRFKFGDTLAGRTGKCQVCGASILIPFPGSMDPEPDPEPEPEPEPEALPELEALSAGDIDILDRIERLERSVSHLQASQRAVLSKASAKPAAAAAVGGISCMGLITAALFIVGIVVVGFCLIPILRVAERSETPPGARAPASSSTPTGTLHEGGFGTLQLPGGEGVWLAATDADWDAMLDAQNEGARGGPGAGSKMYQLAEAGRIRKYSNGTPVRIKKVGVMSLFVEATQGLDAGRSGWVQREFVRGE